MKHTNFPKGINDKLTLDEPDLWDVDEFEGHERMAVSRGNTTLQQIFAETRTALPKLIASVRWSELRMPYRDFAIAAGMSPNGYKPMEKDRAPSAAPHRSKYTRLLAHWEKNNISVGVREQLLDLLAHPELIELHESCTDLLSAVQYIREQSLRLLGVSDMNAFYNHIGYDYGHAQVEKRFPGFYNSIWQREKVGTVPDCLEVVQFVDTLYAGRSSKRREMHSLRRAQGEAVWSAVRKEQYRGRGIEEPLAEFLVLLEHHLATDHGVTFTAQAMRDEYGFGTLHAEKLTQSEWIEGEHVHALARSWMDRRTCSAFLHAWNEAYTIEQKRESFGRLASAAMDERGYTAADVAKLLNVLAPEERGKEAPKQRKQRYRPDSEVRGVLFHSRVSRQIAVEALLQVIARDDAHVDALRAAYFRERERFFRRTGASLKGDGRRMSIMRELANVDMNELARYFLPGNAQKDALAVREKNLELQKLERGEGKKHHITYARVFSILEKLAAERGEEALARVDALDEMDKSFTQFSTVQQMARNLIAGMKGAHAVSDAMREVARNDSEWLRYDLILHMAEGKFVSALPLLRTMAKGTLDSPLPEEVVRDWYERFPEELQRGTMTFGKVTRALPRVLCTLIATKEASPIRFFENRVPGVVPTHGTKHLRDLEKGKRIDWKWIHRYLLAMGLLPAHPSYRLAQGLYEQDGNVDKVLSDLTPILRKQKQDVHPLHLPGLTMAELEQYQSRNTH